MAIFLKYGSLDGGAEAKGYERWTEIETLAWGFSRGLTAAAGGPGREAAAPAVDEVTLAARQTVFSPRLVQEGLRGSPQTARIHYTQTDRSGKHVAYQIYVLENALVTSYAFRTDGEEATESFTIHFQKLDSEYLAIDDAFQVQSQGHVTFDIARPAAR